jgi:hypothetical protein
MQVNEHGHSQAIGRLSFQYSVPAIGLHPYHSFRLIHSFRHRDFFFCVAYVFKKDIHNTQWWHLKILENKQPVGLSY